MGRRPGLSSSGKDAGALEWSPRSSRPGVSPFASTTGTSWWPTSPRKSTAGWEQTLRPEPGGCWVVFAHHKT
eukprot:1270953-Lingulodinium_polyedra.AAC.1